MIFKIFQSVYGVCQSVSHLQIGLEYPLANGYDSLMENCVRTALFAVGTAIFA